MADKNNEPSVEVPEESIPQEDAPSYGWFSYRPNCFQACLSGRWVLVSCCLLIFTQAFVVSGISNLVVTSIEKRYLLRSSQAGVVFAFYDVGSTVLTIVVSYFGYYNKPRWLGVGSLVLALGCFIFVLPQLFVGSYQPAVSEATDLCQTNNHTFLNGTTHDQKTCKNFKWSSLLLFVLGQTIIGAGSSPIFNLGSAYVDENTSRKNSGVFLGIYYSMGAVGAGIGYLLGGFFLSIYIDVVMPEGINLKQDDNSWIGAWWLGYIFGGALALIASIPLLGFPREIPQVKKLNEKKKNALDTVPDDKKPHTTSQFFPALKSLFTNKVFLFTTIGGTAEGFGVAGTSTFLPKFLQSQFHLSSSNASFYGGMVIIPGGILGMLLGGCLIRKFNWTCGQCIRACMIIAFLALFPILIFTVHCPNENFAGVTAPYFNRSSHGSLDACSVLHNCSCKQDKYIPVCTKEDHITYFSPCHAGCTTERISGGEKLYSNCTCLPPNITMAHDGGCVQSCNALGYFLPVLFLLILFTFFNNIPAITVTLRCVPESQGSFALGVQQIITRILAFIPAPIVYGTLLDSVCVLSETDPCDEDVSRNCLEYKNENLSYVFLGATMTCKFISFVFFGLAWLVYKPPRKLAIQESQMDLVRNDKISPNVGMDGGVNNSVTTHM